MSVWGLRKVFHVWGPDYQPENKTGEIWIHAAPSFNDCIRLDACESPSESAAHVGSVMLDREMARELAGYLLAYAETGVAKYEDERTSSPPAPPLGATFHLRASGVRSS